MIVSRKCKHESFADALFLAKRVLKKQAITKFTLGIMTDFQALKDQICLKSELLIIIASKNCTPQ